MPIVNADGFEASRTAGAIAGQDGGRDESVDDTAYLVAGATTGGEYRRKNCRLPDDSAAGNCTTSVGLAENGVDPNRNYGGFWGGPGADTNPLTQTYRGPQPFSEPESRNVKSVVSRHQVMSLITNHTTAGLVLRAPGLAMLGDPVDENRGYKDLGDAMAKENGYFSQKSFELYDTTGTTEDWSYNATGGYGFTFELYCGAPNYETGDCDDPAFHPTYQRVVEEWDGTNPTADHANDPGPNKGYDGKGNREAYYIAAESAINEKRHSVLTGTVTPGTTLRLTKDFKTETFPQQQSDGTMKPLTTDDHLETTYDVDGSGRIRWHVNPSTRPIVAKETGKANPGPPSAPETRNGSPAGAADDPLNDGAAPGGDANANNSLNYNDHPITVPATGDNETMSVKVAWSSPASDYDVKLFEDTNGDGRSQDSEPVVGTSQNGATNEETVSASRPGLQPGKKYVVRVNNFAAVEPYTLTVTYVAPQPLKPAQIESYTLTCERGGRVFGTQQVVVERGQVKAARPEGVLGRDPAGVRGEHDRAALGQRGAQGRRRPLRLQALRQPAGADRRLPGLAGPPRDRRAPGGALQGAPQGGDLERPRGQGRRAVLRPLPDEDPQRQGHGVPPHRPAAAQRPLQPPAGLLPPLDLRPAAELQARAGRVRRAHRDPAADRLPRRGALAHAGDGPARQEGRQALQGAHLGAPAHASPQARVAQAAARRLPRPDHRRPRQGPPHLDAGEPPPVALGGPVPGRYRCAGMRRTEAEPGTILVLTAHEHDPDPAVAAPAPPAGLR